MRRCGVCFVVVHGRVEAGGLKNTGVPNGGSCSGHSRILDSWVACSARDNWFRSVSAVQKCDFGRPTVLVARVPCPSSVCLSPISNCRNPDASLLYLASSAARLGPETCTKISIGGVIMSPHLEEFSLFRVSGLLFICIQFGVVQMLTSNDGISHSDDLPAQVQVPHSLLVSPKTHNPIYHIASLPAKSPTEVRAQALSANRRL